MTMADMALTLILGVVIGIMLAPFINNNRNDDDDWIQYC